MAREIDVRALRNATIAILDHIVQDLGIEKIQIREDRDIYWEVPDDDLYTVGKHQPHLESGRLSDDWDFIEELIKEGEPKIALMLIHIAPLLKMIGTDIGK